MDKEQFQNIAAFLSGDLSRADIELLNLWRKADPENEKAFQEAAAIWAASTKRLSYDGDADADWKDLQHAIERSPRQLTFFQRGWFQIAATITFLICAGIGVGHFYSTTKNHIAKNIVIESGPNVETIMLPDSSVVWLNTNSEIQFDSAFGTVSRTVKLKGEGYFKVKRNEAMPFVVFTRNSATQVLGTSFNIREQGDQTTIMVAEGRVKFSASDTTEAKPLLLAKNESAELQFQQTPVSSRVNGETIGMWRIDNNSAYMLEKKQPELFIVPQHNTNKNAINQSVIKGVLKSNSKLADYKNITLKISYEKANGKVVSNSVKVAGPLPAGGKILFEKRLLDLFSATKNVNVEVISAEIE